MVYNPDDLLLNDVTTLYCVPAVSPVIVYVPDDALTVIADDQLDPPFVEYHTLSIVVSEFHATVKDVSVLDERLWFDDGYLSIGVSVIVPEFEMVSMYVPDQVICKTIDAEIEIDFVPSDPCVIVWFLLIRVRSPVPPIVPLQE